MKKITFILLCLLAVSCVSAKKFKALERDYQNCGSSQRDLEIKLRVSNVEIQQLKHELKQCEKE